MSLFETFSKVRFKRGQSLREILDQPQRELWNKVQAELVLSTHQEVVSNAEIQKCVDSGGGWIFATISDMVTFVRSHKEWTKATNEDKYRTDRENSHRL